MLFENKNALCFGDGAEGRLGNESTNGVAGPGVPDIALTLHNYIVLGGATEPIRSISAGGDFTCILREFGGVYCFGKSTYGQIGMGISSFYGTSTADLVLLTPISFDPPKIPTSIDGYSSRIMILKDTSGKLDTIFNSQITFYFIAVPYDVTEFLIKEIGTVPSTDCSILVNGNHKSIGVPLSDLHVNRVL